MDKNKVYRGIIKTGRGGAVAEISQPGFLEGFRWLTGLTIIAGTLNIDLTEPFDLSLLNYVKFADIGWEFDPATQGIEYDGEIGVYYHRALVAARYPACLLIFTWVTDIYTDAELVSPYRLRSTLGLKDGDVVEFTLADNITGDYPGET
jgi:CTP-dependent riboflavin kinase